MTVHEYDLKGYELLVKEDWDAAIEWYTQALAEHPGEAYLIGRRCDAWVRKGEPEKALEEYTRRIAENPPSPGAGHYDPADMSRPSQDIRRADAFNSRGLLYQQLGEYDKAVADFSEAIPLGWPNYGAYWTNRGIAYREMGNLDAALADMNAAAKAQGSDCTGWMLYQRSLVWERKGEPDKALADLVQATINNPEDCDAFYYLGRFLIYQDEPEKATEAFSKAIELAGDDACYWLARGVSYWNQCIKNKISFWGENSEIMNLAEEDFTKAIELDPKMAEAYLNRGTVHCAKARESQGFIKTILTQKVTDETGRALLMAQLEHMGGHDMVPLFDGLLRGLRSDRDQVDELMAKSLVLFVDADAREAVEDLTQAVALDPKNVEAYYWRGVARTLLGKRDDAIEDYEQALALNPDHAKAAEKRDELLRDN